MQTARTKWAECTATLIKTARLEHTSDSCFGVSILLCWSGGGLRNAHTVTVGKSLGHTCLVAMWLCGCVAALLCSVLSRWTSTLLNQPWPHNLVILSCDSYPLYCSCLLTPQHPPCPRPWRLRSVRFFPPLGSLRLLWDLLPQLNHFWVVLMCLCASSPLWNEGVSCTDLTGSLWVLVDYVRLQGKAEHRGPSYKPPSLLPQGHPTCISHSATFTPLCPCRLCLSHSCCSFHCY